MTDLENCPFCGAEADAVNYVVEGAVQCSGCRATITRRHGAAEDNGYPEAIAAWNRRVPPSPAGGVQAVTDWGDPDDCESVLHALDIAGMATPYNDYQGQLYCHRPYSPDGYRDAEFRDYGLARAVRILCNNAKLIKAALSSQAQTTGGVE